MEFELHNDVTGDAYQSFIEAACKKSAKFHLVIRKEVAVAQSAKAILKKLEPSLIQKVEKSEWASTILDGETAYVYYYHTDDVAKEVLQQAVSSLYAWQQPNFPEDLSFFRDNGADWLATSSREQNCHLTLEPQEAKELLDKVATLQFD